MSTIRGFRIFDQLKFSNVNLDCLTETFYTRFYTEYLIKWPEYCVASVNTLGTIEGYHLGKVEGDKDPATKKWHGHVSAVTVAPDFRRQGLARSLMNLCEEVTEEIHDGWFVDLFVWAGNAVAVWMYEKLGYIVYRRILEYYSDPNGKGEDAFDMRKSMKRDVDKSCVIPIAEPVWPEDLEFN